MRWIVRTLGLLLGALAVLASGCGPSLDAEAADLPRALAAAPAPAPGERSPTIRQSQAIQRVLDQVSTAFRDGDTERLRAYLADPSSAFGQRWQDRARNMQTLPLRGYRLLLDDSLPDLSTERLRESTDGDVQVLYVVEELALTGFDAEPAAEDLFLTLVDRGDGWKVAGDADAEALGLVSVDHLWDHGAVTTTREGPILAIHHPDGPDVEALVDEATAALRTAADRWPRDWPTAVPVVVPRDQEELGQLLHVTFDLSNFVAFAVASPVGELGAYDLTGSRVVVNPARLLDRSPETRERILVHEMIHVATRPSAGPMVPSWLDEGVAQALGERQSTTGTGLVDATVPGELVLPTDAQFTVGGQDRIFLSYQVAWSFVDHLVDTYGARAVGQFYAAVGRGPVGRPGTERFHVDRAAQDVFGAPLVSLVDQWRRSR